MRFSIYILVAFCMVPTMAVELKPVGQPPEARLPIDKDEGNIACDQIQNRLMKYGRMASEHNNNVTAFLSQVTEKLTEWHGLLSPLEGKTQAIEVGQFDILLDGANKINEITNYAFDNTELLANELDRIIVSLRDCNTNQPKK